MAAVDDLQTAYNNLASTLASITANPQPSYSVQGVSLSASEYKSSIIADMEKLQELIIAQSGPYALVTQAVT